MIEIIEDADNLYFGYADIVVDNTENYIKSRLIIDEVKNNARNKAVILITRPSYFPYYKDLHNVPNWSKLTEYSITDVLSTYGLDFNEYEIKKIEKFIGKKDLISFFENYNKTLSIETNLLCSIFENGGDIKEIITHEEFISWMEKSLKKGRAEWRYHKYRNLIEDNINENLDTEFIDELLSVETIMELQKIKERLIATYLFEGYRDSSRNIIKSKVDLFDNVYVSENYVKEIINACPEAIENLNFILFTNKSKLSIFEIKDVYEFLGLTKGYLAEEWNWVWDYLKSNHDCESSDYIKVLREVYTWVNCDNAKYNVKILLGLPEFNEEIGEYKTSQDIKQWYRYYDNFYLKWFSQTDDSRNIICLLNKINDGFLDTTIDKVKTYKDSMEKSYQDYIYGHYPSLLEQGETNIKVINSISEYVDNNKILFFIIDGLRFELWGVIRSLFERNQYFIENDWQYCLSMIPSITSISRTSLVTGKTFRSLVHEKKQSEFSFSLLNEEKHIKKMYPDKSVIFKIGALKDLKELLSEKADIYTFIYSEGDKLFHATEDLLSKSIEPILQNLIDEIVHSVNEHDNMLIVFGTDHGSTINCGNEKAIINIPENIEEEQHGNSIKLFGDYFNQDALDELKNNIDKEKFYTIWREDLGKYGLPRNTVNEEVYGWIFPKYNCYYGTRSKGFNHGGFSMDETIIPYGIFRKQQSDFKELMIELTSISLKLDEACYLDIVVYNPNNFGIKKIVVDMPNINVKDIVNDLSARSKKKVTLQFRIDSSNCENNYFRETLNFSIHYLNNKTSQHIKLNEPVETKVSDAIDKEISEKRTLDF